MRAITSLLLLTLISFGNADEVDSEIDMMARSILNDRNLGVGVKIRNAFTKIEKDGMDILMEPDPNQCIDMIQETGIIELIYAEMVELHSLYNEDIMNKMIEVIGKQLCIQEGMEFQSTKDRFHRMSEHLQNEVVDEILTVGNQQEAWTAESYTKCIDQIQAIAGRLETELKEKYIVLNRLRKFKKLLISIIYDTCDSYFKDKRDL